MINIFLFIILVTCCGAICLDFDSLPNDATNSKCSTGFIPECTIRYLQLEWSHKVLEITTCHTIWPNTNNGWQAQPIKNCIEKKRVHRICCSQTNVLQLLSAAQQKSGEINIVVNNYGTINMNK